MPIYALTPQNEPLNTDDMPTMGMSASQEATFIANNLGPDFVSNGLATQILDYDHNWDDTSYPATVLNSSAAQYVAGTAYHCYGGDPSGQTTTHDAFPDKDIYMTECSGGSWENNNNPTWSATFRNVMELLINATRNWAKSVVRWGMALDTNNGPYLNTSSACATCRGIVTIDQNNGDVTYNSDYYGLGQASKFVQQGAYRIDSNFFGAGNIEDVAFMNSDGSIALVVYNGDSSSNTFQVEWNNEAFSYKLPAGAAATFTWSDGKATATPTTTDGQSSATPTPTTTDGQSSTAPTPTTSSNQSGATTTPAPTTGSVRSAVVSTPTTSDVTPTPTTGQVQNGVYSIVNHHSGLVLDDTGWSTSDGTAIQQWSKAGNQANQQWKLVATGDGYYYIVNRYSGLVLDDTGWSTSDGTAIQQWSKAGNQANQQWKLVATGDGYYYIVNRYSGLVLDDTGWSTSDGTSIQQWSQVGNQTNQQWSLIAD